MLRLLGVLMVSTLLMSKSAFSQEPEASRNALDSIAQCENKQIDEISQTVEDYLFIVTYLANEPFLVLHNILPISTRAFGDLNRKAETLCEKHKIGFGALIKAWFETPEMFFTPKWWPESELFIPSVGSEEWIELIKTSDSNINLGDFPKIMFRKQDPCYFINPDYDLELKINEGAEVKINETVYEFHENKWEAEQ